jgi:Nucleoside diphosphate kinase
MSTSSSHAEKPFFGELVDFITSGPLVAIAAAGTSVTSAGWLNGNRDRAGTVSGRSPGRSGTSGAGEATREAYEAGRVVRSRYR